MYKNKVRIISRLEVKGLNVVKGIQMEGLRVVGKPEELSDNYFKQGIDEIIFSDIVASLYNRNHLSELVNTVANKIFIPLCVGGGIRKIDDIRNLLRSGADKISINTEATKSPALIEAAAKTYGSQCIVSSIHAKKIAEGKWEPYIENGRERTHLDVVDWAKRLESLGTGEIMLISVDKDGTRKGFDIDLIKSVSDSVSIPIIACGGAGSLEHIEELFQKTNISAVALSNILHFNKFNVSSIKEHLNSKNVLTRKNWTKIG